MKGPKLCSTIMYYAATVALIFLIMMNPLLRDDHDTHLQDIIPTRVSIKRLINPLQRDMNDNPHLRLEVDGASKNKNVYKYIRDEIFHEDGIEDISKDTVSPFHKATMLMGCYGDLWPKNEKFPSVLASVVGQSFEKPFMFNLMLQALDDHYGHSTPGFRGWDGVKYDKSACDCMRDFASPNFMHVRKDVKCEDSLHHDSCSVQNMIDYALDGTGLPTNGSLTQLQIMSLVTVRTEGTSRFRNRQDPMLYEFQRYYDEAGLSSSLTALLTTKPNLKLFIDHYCLVAGYRPEFMPDIKDEEKLARFINRYNRQCPFAWSETTTFANVKIGEVMPLITQWIQNMHAYNTLRTPTLTSGPASFDVYPPNITSDGYKLYLSKYQAAFETCAHAGVPQYFMRVTNYTDATHWHVAGEILLLLAASVAFFWAYVIETTVTTVNKEQAARTQGGDENKEEQSATQRLANTVQMINDFFCYVSVIFPIILSCLGIYRLSEFSNKGFLDHQETKLYTNPSQQSEFLAVFVVLWWVLLIALLGIILLFIAHIIVKTKHLFKFITTFKLVSRYEGGDPITEFSDLNELAFAAQIAMDVPIIVGLTLIAVGSTMQQGVVDYYVIMTVIVFFTLIGLTTHITNVLRLMHLTAQWEILQTNETKESVSKHVGSIKYNRVAIGVIIALMLYAYLCLAGLDSYQGPSYGAQHQTIFAFVAFLILCVSDLTLEFLCLFQRSDPYPSGAHYFYDIISKKARNTVWMILLSIFVLNVHLHFVVCQRSAPLEGRADVCAWTLAKA